MKPIQSKESSAILTAPQQEYSQQVRDADQPLYIWFNGEAACEMSALLPGKSSSSTKAGALIMHTNRIKRMTYSNDYKGTSQTNLVRRRNDSKAL